MQRFPVGVVAKDGDGYVGTCADVGTTSVGRTMEEAFANLRAATWQHIERQRNANRAVEGSRPNERQAMYMGVQTPR